MKVDRLSGVCTHTLNKVVKYELPQTPDTKYIVDDSGFVPMSEAVKQLSKVSTSREVEEMCYDFKDGKDTGMRVPVQRMGMSDITEISTSIMEDIHEITDKIEKGRKKLKAESDFSAKLNSIRSVQNDQVAKTPSSSSSN